MLIRLCVRQSWQQPNIELFTNPLNCRFSHGCGNNFVSIQWQMWTMLLDRAHWLLRAEQLVEHVAAIIGSEA